MEPDVVQSRREAYLNLLQNGLVAIRNHAHAGKMSLCEIEADHIHNVPSLLYESNELRHQYFIHKERSLYLDRLRRSGETEYLEWMSIWYHDSWKVLESIAGQARSGDEGIEQA